MSLRFGLIGLGKHGSNAVSPAFYDEVCTGGDLVAVCDVSPAATGAFERPVEGKYNDHHTMLAEAGLDAVYIAAGMDHHYRLVTDSLRAGKHVIVEKPMAATLGECQEMIDLAEASGLALAVNFETRYGEQNDILRRWIREGRLGEINALHFANMWDGHKSFGPIKERRARLMELAGALDCGIHKLDQARFLVGGTWAEVFARGAWMGEDFTPPTHIGIVGQLDNGVLVTLNASLSWAGHIEPRPMVNTLEIAGTEGVALCRSSYDFKGMTIELYSRTLTETHELRPTGHTSDIVLVINEFAEVVTNGRTPETILASGEDGYWAQYATEQANNQSIQGRIKPKV
jgi:1,5-anhydro-D-fructose reductase (1,5-anhydro-D-mannitol-forming)